MGETGSSTGVHLHWEVLANGDALGNGNSTSSNGSTTTNPLQFFRSNHSSIRVWEIQ